MTGIDIIVLIVVGVSALLAFARGFVREFLSMSALIVAILAVIWSFPIIRDPMRNLTEPAWVADTISVVSVFIIVYVIIRVITGRIHEWVHDSEPLGMLDRAAGIAFGVLRGFAIMSIIVIAISSVAKPEKLPKFLKDAKFYPFLVLFGDSLEALIPDASKTAANLAKSASEAGQDIANLKKVSNSSNSETIEGSEENTLGKISSKSFKAHEKKLINQ